jgi:hypothetical protein
MTERPLTPASANAGGDVEGHYTAYDEHAKTLRTWLVAYGIGAPVLILSQHEIWESLKHTHSLRLIAGLFIVGVVVQVTLAAVNKTAMWACYFGSTNKAFSKTRRYRFFHWLSKQYWIDLICDLSAMALFAYATYLTFVYLVPPDAP